MAPYIPRVISLLLLPLMTSHLTAADFGIIGVISAYSASISVLSSLGFVNILFSSFYQYHNQYKIIWKRIYGILVLWSIIFIFFQIGFYYLLMPKEALVDTWLIIFLLVVSNIFSETSLIGNAYYQLNLKPLPIAIRTVISGGLMILINYYLVVYENMGYLGYFMALAISNFVVNISYFPLLILKVKVYPVFKIKKYVLNKYFKILMPTIPHYYTNFLLNSSNRVVMEASSVPISQIGQVNISQQFFNIIESIYIAANQAITPIVYNEIKSGSNYKIKGIVYNLFFVSLFITFNFSIWSKEIFYFLIKNDLLKNGYKLALVLVMSLNFRPLYLLNSYFYFYYQNTLEILKISVVSGIIAVLGYIIFIPFFGLWGYVLVFYVSMIYMGIGGFYFKFLSSVFAEKFNTIPIVFSTICFTFFLYFSVELDFIFKFFVGILFNIGLLGTYVYLKLYDLNIFKEINVNSISKN